MTRDSGLTFDTSRENCRALIIEPVRVLCVLQTSYYREAGTFIGKAPDIIRRGDSAGYVYSANNFPRSTVSSLNSNCGYLFRTVTLSCIINA